VTTARLIVGDGLGADEFDRTDRPVKELTEGRGEAE